MPHQPADEFRAIFEQTAVGVAKIETATGRFVRINQCYADMLGYSPEEMQRLDFQTITHPDDLQQDLDNMRRLVAGEIRNFTMEKRYVRKDGEVVWVGLTVSPMWRPGESPAFHIAVVENITNRKRAEKTLLESEALVRSIGNNLPNGMLYQVIRNPDGSRRFAYVSDAVRRFYGCSPEEALTDASRIYGRIAEEDRLRLWNEEEHANRHLIPFSTKARMINPSGDIRWSHFASSPRRLEDGSTCWDGIETDITEHKRTEEALIRRAEELTALKELGREANANLSLEQAAKAGLRGMLKAVRPDLAFLFLRQGDRLILQEVLPPTSRLRLEDIPEHRVGECICGLAISENKPLFSLDIFDDPRCTWDECKQSGIKSFAALPLHDSEKAIGVIGLASESPRDFERQAEFLETLSSQVSGALINARLFNEVQQELVERKRMEEALQESEKRFRLIAENSADMISCHDAEGVYRYASPACRELLGYEPEELMGHSAFEFIHPDDREKIERSRLSMLKRPVVDIVVYRIRRKDGAYIWFESTSHSIQDAETGKTMEFQVSTRDITERKVAEDALRAASVRQDALLSAIPDIIMEVNAEQVYTWANQAGLAFFGSDVIGKEAGFFFEGERDIDGKAPSFFQREEEVSYTESLQRRADGQKRLLAWWRRVLKDENGRVTGALSSARDITEQKTLEEQLLQAQKMESVGRLAGGVAHDFNNMLQSIIGHTDLVLSDIGADSDLRENLLEISKAAVRSVDLTRQLLAFARKQTVHPRILDLNDTVAGILKMLRRLIGEDIELIWKPGANLWSVRMDPTQMDQILANLGVNARDAITGVGTLVIETNNTVLDETDPEVQAGFLPGEYIRLSVSDDGCGMDKDVIRNHSCPKTVLK